MLNLFGFEITTISLVIVLLALIALAIIIWLLFTFVDSSKRKKAHVAAATVLAATVVAAPIPEPVTPKPVMAPVIAGINPKTVAAIMAAVSMASGSPQSKLRFTAIRRGNTTNNVWAASSTADIIANRQTYL
jgi:hypothetical protein